MSKKGPLSFQERHNIKYAIEKLASFGIAATPHGQKAPAPRQLDAEPKLATHEQGHVHQARQVLEKHGYVLTEPTWIELPSNENIFYNPNEGKATAQERAHALRMIREGQTDRIDPTAAKLAQMRQTKLSRSFFNPPTSTY